MKHLTKLGQSLALILVFLSIGDMGAQNADFGFEFGSVTTMENLYLGPGRPGRYPKMAERQYRGEHMVGWGRRHLGVQGPAHRGRAFRKTIRELYPPCRMEAYGSRRKFGHIRLEQCQPRRRQGTADGLEIQMLELDWVNLNLRDGKKPPIAYVHGELFGVGGVTTVPDNPRGERSKSIENRAKGKGIWNTYDVVCVDGVVKLAVNGKFVNGISKVSQKKGYLCLESEGAEIHFRNLRVTELPPGVTSMEQIAPELK